MKYNIGYEVKIGEIYIKCNIVSMPESYFWHGLKISVNWYDI